MTLDLYLQSLNLRSHFLGTLERNWAWEVRGHHALHLAFHRQFQVAEDCNEVWQRHAWVLQVHEWRKRISAPLPLTLNPLWITEWGGFLCLLLQALHGRRKNKAMVVSVSQSRNPRSAFILWSICIPASWWQSWVLTELRKTLHYTIQVCGVRTADMTASTLHACSIRRNCTLPLHLLKLSTRTHRCLAQSRWSCGCPIQAPRRHARSMHDLHTQAY